MHICYYLAAIGSPYYNTKKSILKANLKLLSKYAKIDLFICSYDEYGSTDEIEEYIDNIYIYNKKYMLAEFWLTNPHNELLDNYDYVLLILDDVLLMSNFNLNEMINKYKQWNLDIISPQIHGSGYLYLNSKHDNFNMAITNVLEFFVYLMTPASFKRYLDTLTMENKWTCGNDLLLGHFGIKTGVYYNCTAKHVLRPIDPTTVDDKDRMKNERDLIMLKMLKENGFTWDSIIKNMKIWFYR